MELNADILYAVSFGLWAGVVGISVRAVLQRLDSLAARIMETEKAVAKLSTKVEMLHNR